MTARAMKCISAEKHPNAEVLFVYEFEAGSETLKIVANSENIYEINDIVTIVKAPSLLKDGNEVHATSIRGVRSYGMALGKTEAKLGKDLSEIYCVKEVINSDNIVFKSWPKIGHFSGVSYHANKQAVKPIIDFRGKIKLDGTNAGIQLFADGTVVSQSRGRILSIGSDNYGFCAWIHGRKDYLQSVIKNSKLDHMIIFGEYCGPGIQGRAAAGQTAKKYLAVFAIQIGSDYETDPSKIKALLGESVKFDIHVLDWETEKTSFDFSDRIKIAHLVNEINDKVLNVEECDPWVRDNFKVEGIGEGLVYYPVTNGTLISKSLYSEFVFKAKGEKHSVTKVKKAAQMDPAKIGSVVAFSEMFVTENRLEQIYEKLMQEEEGPSMKLTGKFVKTFCEDIQNECGVELGESGLTWKMVSKVINGKAVSWWKSKLDEAL